MQLYTPKQSHDIDRQAIHQGADGFVLMQQAAASACKAFLSQWPKVKKPAILAGCGNNGGDALVMACLLARQGLKPDVFLIGDESKIKNEAAKALAMFYEQGLQFKAFSSDLVCNYEVIVDGLLGVGQKGAPREPIASALQWLASSDADVMALDVPTGICALTGDKLSPHVVKASLTISFVVPKIGLSIAYGREYSGKKLLEPLGLKPHEPGFELLEPLILQNLREPRPLMAHKGLFGHVLVVGGDEGYGGAPLLVGEAALKAGAGKVSVATKACHVPAIISRCPELMAKAVEAGDDFGRLLKEADVVVLGPGIGQNAWGEALAKQVLLEQKPTVIDADALNIVACWQKAADLSFAVMTPHPKEAARLLGIEVKTVQADRPKAAQDLHKKYQAKVLLKGAGSLMVGSGLYVCGNGSPALSVAGTGDVLSGIIASFWAQQQDGELALTQGVLVHALAGEHLAALKGERGILASQISDTIGCIIDAKN